MDNKSEQNRITGLLIVGLLAGTVALLGDLLLGWGTYDPALEGLARKLSIYSDISDARIFWSGLLGMIGITLETLCFFGVYRIISSVSERYAHAYRAGLIGMLAFGPFCHVMCCASVYYHNALYRIDPGSAIGGTMDFAKFFLLPVSAVFFVFFLVMNIVQIMAFAKGKTR